MTGRIIYLFMWAYQESYRIHVQILIRDTLKKLGVPPEAEVLLVGARSPNSKKSNSVCVEPEDGKWQLSLFDGLLNSIELNYQNHHLKDMFFGDAQSMRDKPEWMRQGSVRQSVSSALKAFDTKNNVTSFCGDVRLVGDYYVTPVIQIPNSTFVKFPPLPSMPVNNVHVRQGFRSLIHATVHAVLDEATEELNKPEPGRFTHDRMRNGDEIVRIAAKNFLHTPGLAIQRGYMYTDLFSALNLVSSLMYEGAKGVGQLIIVDPDNEFVEFLARFVEPVPFDEPRWVRKVLQMATTGVGLIANSRYIFGLGRLNSLHDAIAQDAFIVAFLDHYHWELRCGSQALIRSHYAVPKQPQEPVDKMSFLAHYKRLFASSTAEDGMNLWNLLLVQIGQGHGSMIVVAEDAAVESQRLNKQGTSIEPTRFNDLLLRSVSGIDGTILLDPSGLCHAIGIILDGEATEQCTPSRGSRYNSGVRYVQSNSHRRLAIVVSDDGTIDIIPRIQSLVSRSQIEMHVSNLETASVENYHDSKNWLDAHRFYINEEQVSRINRAISRLNTLPRQDGVIRFETRIFEVNPELEDSFLTD